MIPLHRPIYYQKEQEYLQSAMAYRTGQTSFCALCEEWLTDYMHVPALMTTSCSTSLDLAAALLHGKPGDEVIMPSFTFASTANAFVRQGLVPVFVDVRKDTMNLDEKKIEAAITNRTIAIVPVHYAGVACAMDEIGQIAEGYHLSVIEDVAQGLGAYYKGRPLGSFGDFSCISFHETKNFSMGEGGALFVKDMQKFAEAEIMADCGTDRKKVRRKEATEYSWIAKGASCIPSDMSCMFLYPQLKMAQEITENRRKTWDFYKESLKKLEENERLLLPVVPKECEHNGHIFAIRLENKGERDDLMRYLKEIGINAAFHYIPLHSAMAGRKYGRFHGIDEVTTAESERLLRLPLYYGMTEEDKGRVVDAVYTWFGKK